MPKQLGKIASDCGVGVNTLVEHLRKKYNRTDIDPKPNFKIEDDLAEALTRDFAKDISAKTQAESLNIGVRKPVEPAAPVSAPLPVSPAVPPSSPTPIEAATPAVTAPTIQSEPIAPVSPEPPSNSAATDKPVVELKVVGKIDLESRRGKGRSAGTGKHDTKGQPATEKKATTPTQDKEESLSAKESAITQREAAASANTSQQETLPKPLVSEEPTAPLQEPVAKPAELPAAEMPLPEAPSVQAEVVSTSSDAVPDNTNAESDGTSKSEEYFRAETPQLRGVRQVGLIDLEKFKEADRIGGANRRREKDKAKKRADEAQRNRPVVPANPTPAASSPNATPSHRDSTPPSREEADKKRLGLITSSTDEAKRQRQRKPVAIEGSTPAHGPDRPVVPANNSPRERPANSSGVGRERASSGGGRDRERERGKKGGKAESFTSKDVDTAFRKTMGKIGDKQRGNFGKKSTRSERDDRKERQRQLDDNTEPTKLQVTEFITVSELAALLDVSASEVISVCMSLNIFAGINQRLDAEIIELVAGEFGREVEFISISETEDEDEDTDNEEDLVPRAPIVTVMGHVDHGKTSLLDYIRKANVAGGEAGGITQHIGAYEVVTKTGKKVTFLDTPGHEAFTAMRARGAKVTDIAVIIVAADDSVMPQTKEAISHAQAAGVPMVFAINKVDKPGANPEKIKEQLSQMNILVEDWGGKYQSQDISAKKGTGIDELLEKILLEAELLELKANPNRRAIGSVIEATLDKGRGYIAKVLIEKGTLRIGDPIVSGQYSGKVKAMFNEHKKTLKEAGPATPLLVLGLNGAPQAGEKIKVTKDDAEARQIASRRAQIAQEQAVRATKRISLSEIGRRLALGSFKQLNIVLKADVDGSAEALADSLLRLSTETVSVRIVHKGVGPVTDTDVMLASASDALVVAFQVRPSPATRKLAEQEGVEIKTYNVIYDAIDEVTKAIEGMLEPTKEEQLVATLEVREVFNISKVGTVAGCYVQDGKITRNTLVRVYRDGILVYPKKDGTPAELNSLKRHKDDVKEVKAGFECGLTVKGFDDIEIGDIIEGYEVVEVKQKLG